MEYKVETSLWDFQAWSGGADTLATLKEKGDCGAVEQFLEDYFAGSEEIPTDTQINDILWFERDWIAEQLGYRDWDAYEYEGWSLSDLEDAEEWWQEDAEIEDKERLSGKEVSDFADEYDWDEAVDEWWNSLSENEKVDIYYQES